MTPAEKDLLHVVRNHGEIITRSLYVDEPSRYETILYKYDGQYYLCYMVNNETVAFIVTE